MNVDESCLHQKPARSEHQSSNEQRHDAQETDRPMNSEQSSKDLQLPNVCPTSIERSAFLPSAYDPVASSPSNQHLEDTPVDHSSPSRYEHEGASDAGRISSVLTSGQPHLLTAHTSPTLQPAIVTSESLSSAVSSWIDPSIMSTTTADDEWSTYQPRSDDHSYLVPEYRASSIPPFPESYYVPASTSSFEQDVDALVGGPSFVHSEPTEQHGSLLEPYERGATPVQRAPTVHWQWNVREGTPVPNPEFIFTEREVDSFVYVEANSTRPQSSVYSGKGSTDSSSSCLSITSSSEPAVMTCDGCGATFTGQYRRGNLRRHKRRMHNSKPGAYQCPEPDCHRYFNRSDARLKHYRKHHPHLMTAPPVPRR